MLPHRCLLTVAGMAPTPSPSPPLHYATVSRMTKDEIAIRLAELKRKLKARENRAEYLENIEAIKRAIADLEHALQAIHD